MLTFLAAALAGAPDPAHFEPSVAHERGTHAFSAGGQTYYDGRFAISGASVALRFDGPSHVLVGFDARFLDDPYASTHWDVHAANVWLGYAIIDRERVRVAPYVRAGSHLQAGVAAAVRAPLSPKVDLVLDASAGPSMRAPWAVSWHPDRLRGVFAEPGLPEAGIGLQTDMPWRPSLRVGVLGDQIAVSAGTASKEGLWLRGTVTRSPFAPRGVALFQVGLDY